MKPWQQTHNGMTWRDMPGDTIDQKRLNFFLFRRGLFDPEGWKDKFHKANTIPSHSRRARRQVARENKIDRIAEEIEYNSRPENEQI